MSRSSSGASQIKLRLKFRAQFIPFSIDSSDHVDKLIRVAAESFNLNSKNVEVSLNAHEFVGIQKAQISLREMGIVSGDVIYIKSLEALDDIKGTLENETVEQLSVAAERLHFTAKCAGLAPAIFPLQLAAEAKGLHLSMSDDMIQTVVGRSASDIIRLIYVYSLANARLTFTLFTSGIYLNYTCGASNIDFRNQIAVHMRTHFVDMRLLDCDACKNVKYLYKTPRNLIFQLMDELIEPVLIQLHEQLNLKPRLNIWSLSPYMLTHILSYLNLADLSRVFRICKRMHLFIRTSELVWRHNLARFEAKRRNVAEAAMQRVHCISRVSPEPDIWMKKSDSMGLVTEEEIRKEETEDCASFLKFLHRYRMLSKRRGYQQASVYM